MDKKTVVPLTEMGYYEFYKDILTALTEWS